MKWRFAIPAFVFAALFGVFGWMLYRSKSGDYIPKLIPSAIVGKPAPQFRLLKVEDPTQFVDSKEFAGRVYVVNVWGTWCVGCAQEHPVLLELARRNEVPIIGLDTKDTLEDSQRWLAQRGNPYVATALDTDGRAAIDWGVYGAPETFLVDASGMVLYRHIAPLSIDVWEREFITRINQLNSKSTP
jgi:cytochrome c biogenesis protein CcmG, thiol:disulfide interchange protein DsbE